MELILESPDAQGKPEPPESPESKRERAHDGPPAGEARSDDELFQEALVLLFASVEPLSDARLVELLERPDPARLPALLERIAAELASSRLPIVLKKIAGGWRLMTDPRFGPVVDRLRADPRPERISAAALETLAIVAYRQPVTKAEIEAIRGVQVGPILRTLVDRGLVRVTGRASLPGAPLQYGTTREFLERFGLSSLKDLPRDGELVEE